MKDEDKTKEQLINEFAELRNRIDQVEASESECEWAAKALRESEERFRTIVETAKDAIIMIDGEGRISYWNPAAEEIFGYASQEVIGEELLIIIPERYRKDYRKGFCAFKETGQDPAIGKLFESESIKKNGTEFPVEFSISAIQIKGQWHAVGIARDITDRKRMEESLRESWKRYRVLFDIEREAIMLIDLETQRFLEVNRAAEQLYGYSKEEFLTMRTAEVSAEPEETDFRIKEVGYQSAAGFPVFKHKKKDGTVFPAEISACTFMWKNRRTSCEIVRDVIEHQQDS